MSIIGRAGGFMGLGSAITYATWNPSDKGSAVVLSGGDLTSTSVLSAGSVVRSTIGKSSGKWYWEITPNSTFSEIGIATSTASLAGDALAVGFWIYYGGTGNKYINGSGSGYGATFSTEVIGIALDMDAGTLVCYKANSSQGTLVSGLSGTYYAAVAAANNGSIAFTANFGASAFTYSPPGGYNAGLY